MAGHEESMPLRDKIDQLLHRLGDTLFMLRDRLDKLSPPSWRDVRDAAGNIEPVDWSRLRTFKGWRDMLRERPGVVGGFAGVIMLIAAASLLLQFRTPPERVETIWYFNESTQKLVAAEDQLSPARATAVGADDLVRAYVYSCGECSDESSLFVGYLEKFPPDVKASVVRYSRIGSDTGVIMPRALVKRRADREWVPADGDEADNIKRTPTCENDGAIRQCSGPVNASR